MRIEPLALPGVVQLHEEPHRDDRGEFVRLFCQDTLGVAGIAFAPSQISMSRNTAASTLRGMHWQEGAHAESKLVRVMRGAIHDVVVDLRAASPAFLQWIAVELDASTGRSLLLPPGVAHGFLTLQPETDVLYAIDARYAPGAARGARWNDPAFGIQWPAQPDVMSERDRSWPDFDRSRSA